MDASEYRRRAADFRAAAKIGTARPSQYLLNRADEFEKAAEALERGHSGEKPARHSTANAGTGSDLTAEAEPLQFYHFKIFLADVQREDLKGRALADVDAAYHVAIEGIRALLSEEVAQGRMDLRGHVEVLDAAMKIVMTIPFGAAVQVILPDARRGSQVNPGSQILGPRSN